MVIFVTYIRLYNINNLGIRKKILAQIKVFEKFFGKVYYTCYNGSMICLMCKDIIIEKELAVTKERYNEIIALWIDKYKIKRVYVRYEYADKWFINLLKKIRKRTLKAIVEIPTYPNDGEITDRRIKLEDMYYREEICNYIDVVATNADEAMVLGMRCIKLMNGIDLDENPLRVREREERRIVLIGVSSLLFWQGYERIIEGIYDYYKKGGQWDLVFKIVGEGPEKAAYKTLVEKYQLQQRVEFYGWLEGQELDRQYGLADIAVSSLGRYKSEIQHITPIKGAEYCARGIPFICGYHDMRFAGDEDFIMNVSNAPDPIDMNAVTDFYKKVMMNDGYQEQMRNYAENYLSWDVVMRPIVEYFM